MDWIYLFKSKKIIDPDTFRKKIFEFKRIDYGNKSLSPDAAILRIECSPQPIYHKNFELVIDSFTSFLKEGYTLYILSDSEKQIQRIQSIFEDKGENISFTPVQKTLHEGFIDRELTLQTRRVVNMHYCQKLPIVHDFAHAARHRQLAVCGQLFQESRRLFI
jgi:hypothetical protein